jgi:hypothetical protein
MLLEGAEVAFTPTTLQAFRKPEWDPSTNDGGEPGREGPDRDKDNEDETVTFQLTRARAMQIFTNACGGADDAAEGEEGDEDIGDVVEREAASFFGEKKRAASDDKGGPSKKRKGALASKFALRSEAEEITYLSTNFRTTQMPMPKLADVPEKEWIRLALTEFINTKYEDKGHMCVSQDMLAEFVADIKTQYPYFPAKPTVASVWEVVGEEVLARRLIAADSSTGKFAARAMMEPRRIAATGQRPGMKVGLPWPANQEKTLAESLGNLVSGSSPGLRRNFAEMYAADLPSQPEILLNRDNPPTLAMGDEQWQAFPLACTSPLTLISGAGGTGKSTFMKMVFRHLRRRDSWYANKTAPDDDDKFFTTKYLFVAFKVNTVTDMSDGIGATWARYHDLDSMGSEDKFEDVCCFNTCDYFRMRFNPKRKSSKKIRANVIFFDEASMLSVEQLSEFISAVDLDYVSHMIIIGDHMQLPPIRPGNPFPVLLEAFPEATVHFKTVFRTSDESLRKNIEAVREGRPDDLMVDDATTVSNESTFGFIDMESDLFRKVPAYSQKMVANVEGILEMMDPDKTRYKDIIVVTQYNDVAQVVSKAVSERYFPLEGPKVGPEWATVFHVGQRVVFLKTDKTVGAGVGKLGYISDIIDHSGPIPPIGAEAGNGQIVRHHVKNTAGRVEGDSRTICIQCKDNTVVLTFHKGYGMHSIIGDGACITVHGSQGYEFPIVICVFANGQNLIDRRIAYTAISRTRDHCFVIADYNLFRRMIETPPEDCETMLDAFLDNAVDHDQFRNTIARAAAPVPVFNYEGVDDDAAAEMLSRVELGIVDRPQ